MKTMKLITIEHCSDCPYNIESRCLVGDHAISAEDFLHSPNFPDSCTLQNADSPSKTNGAKAMEEISSILKTHGIAV